MEEKEERGGCTDHKHDLDHASEEETQFAA